MSKKISLFVILLGFAGPLVAEEELEIYWTPYLWASNLEADLDFGRGPVNTELDFKDILDKLEMTYMHHLEFKKGRWGIANEIIYFDISDSAKDPVPGISKADVQMKQTLVDLVATYYAGEDENTTLFGGLRYIKVDPTLETESPLPPLNLKFDGDKDWTNLLMGVRQVFPLNERWNLWGIGDVASDFDDELSYIITLGANYYMTELLDLKFGYRYARIEYEDSDIKLDEDIDGVFAGLTFKW